MKAIDEIVSQVSSICWRPYCRGKLNRYLIFFSNWRSPEVNNLRLVQWLSPALREFKLLFFCFAMLFAWGLRSQHCHLIFQKMISPSPLHRPPRTSHVVSAFLAWRRAKECDKIICQLNLHTFEDLSWIHTKRLMLKSYWSEIEESLGDITVYFCS